MNSKIGMFSILTLGVMMLLIPATSIASAQEYDKYYKENERYNDNYSYENERYYDDYRQTDDRKSYYEEPYKKGDKKDKPVVIIKNEPVPQKEKKMKEPPMILVTKEVLFCDEIANGTSNGCLEFNQQGPPTVPGPNSDRYVQNCNHEQCENIDAELFTLEINKNPKFQGSEEGTKINYNENAFTVEEASEFENFGPFSFACDESGFDSVTAERLDNSEIIAVSCLLFEGECSGTIQDGELKECTVKNYVVELTD